MHKFREILRLKYDAQLSHRQIARAMNVSQGAVSKYVSLAQACRLGWPLPDGLDDAALEAKRVQAQQTLSVLQAKGQATRIQQRFLVHLNEEIAMLQTDQASTQALLRDASYAVPQTGWRDSSASSPVEGRNGYLSQLNHCARGTPARRLKVLTVIHNFDLKRADGATAAERLFGTPFPDLFDWVMERMGALPAPR